MLSIKKMFTVLLAVSTAVSLFSRELYNDIRVAGENKESPHAFFTISDSFESALKPLSCDDVGNIYVGNSYLSLNGDWKFKFVENHEKLDSDVFGKNFDDSSWRTIPVPSTWQTLGYDTISYTNVYHEFMFDRQGRRLDGFESKDGKIPELIAESTIVEMHRQAGLYRRTFELPKDWSGKEVFVKFSAVKSGFKLYVNGSYVGYSQDSFTPAEFNITKYVKAGKNSISLIVYKYTAGSFLELQDMPHTMGILRDVTLIARPQVFLRDYYATCNFSDDLKNADFKCEFTLSNLSGKARKNLKIELFLADDKGKLLGDKAIISKDIPEIAAGKDVTLSGDAKLSNFKLWSPDKPNLYTLVMRLQNSESKDLEVARADWGFRKFEIRGNRLYFNNVPFLIKGVNRHNWSPEGGSVVGLDLMKKDCELIKRANINAIRTSHYPNDEKFYMLCSRYGLAVLDENNHETHELRRFLPAENDLFVEPSLVRIRNLVMRDRNVPCVIIWSLGNESGTYHTKSHKAMEAEARRIDPTRPIHSEPGAGQESNTSDFVSPMYGGMWRMQQHLNSKSTKPFIFCEYCFAIGNAIGNLKQIWNMMRSNDSLNGGFIWDWCDRTLYLKDENGVKYLADGRDFGTRPNAGTWCASGIVFADRTYSSKYFEVARVYQDIQISEIDAKVGKFKLSNEFVSTDLSELDVKIEVFRDGTLIAKSSAAAPELKPGDSGEFEFNMPSFDSSKSGEYYCNISFLRRAKTLFSKPGEVASFAQFPLLKVESKKSLPTMGSLRYFTKDSKTTVVAGGVSYVFDNANPRLEAINLKGKNIMTYPLKFDITAAIVDNGRSFRRDLQNYQLGSLKQIDKSLSVEKLSADALRVKCSETLVNEDGDGFIVDYVYTILAGSAMEVAVNVTKLNDMPERLYIPRVGLKMGLDKSLSDVKYFGRGPLQNYCDALEAAPLGIYNIDISKEIPAYAKPQDCGNREGVRLMTIRTEDGGGIAVFAPKFPLAMSILGNTQEELSAAKHFHNLPQSSQNEFRVAGFVAGIGNGALGPETLDEFLPTFKGSYSFSFAVAPISKDRKFGSLIGLDFPEKYKAKFEKKTENLRNETLKPKPEGEWVSKNAKVSYSSREDMYAPKRDTLLECAGENFAFHTKRDEDRQFLIVDLGKPMDITGAIIYNRKDEQGKRTDRLRMYISEDSKSWNKVWSSDLAKRYWTVKFENPKKARYVKLVLEKKEYFHLSGLKIFAK